MNFRTEIDVLPLSIEIDHGSKGLAVGSCFAENISERLIRTKFPVCVNPFGVMYNPVSVAQTLDRLAGGTHFTHKDLHRYNDLWFSYSCHGSLSAVQVDEALAKMNNALTDGAEALKNADYIIITLGTAWVYEHKDSGEIVANCHKRPSSEFTRRRLTMKEVWAVLDKLMSGVLRDRKVIFTISPIRHIKDGLAENNVSKSTLRVAVAEIVQEYKNACYFPAFEIVTDDLRDYRFYAADMVHPSDTAVDYIWEKFTGAVMSADTLALNSQIEKVVTAAAHRPFNADTDAHREFCRAMLHKAEEISRKHPEVDMSGEIIYFRNVAGKEQDK